MLKMFLLLFMNLQKLTVKCLSNIKFYSGYECSVVFNGHLVTTLQIELKSQKTTKLVPKSFWHKLFKPLYKLTYA